MLDAMIPRSKMEMLMNKNLHKFMNNGERCNMQHIANQSGNAAYFFHQKYPERLRRDGYWEPIGGSLGIFRLSSFESDYNRWVKDNVLLPTKFSYSEGYVRRIILKQKPRPIKVTKAASKAI